MNRGKITTIHDMLLNSQNKYSNRVAFKRFNGEIIDEISYDRFVSDVMSVSSYFDEFKNQRFGIYAYMSYEWIVLFYAILYSGNTAVLFNRDYNVHELDEALEIVELEGMFSDLEDAYINRTVSVDEIVEEYKQKTASSVEKKINKNDIAIIIFTSGTTGKSKCVQLTNLNLCANLIGCFSLIGDVLNGEKYTSNMTVLPPHHAYQITVGIQYQIAFGGSVCISRNSKFFMQDLKRFKPGALVLVPMVVEMIYKKINLSISKQKKKRLFSVMIVISKALMKIGIDIRRKLFKRVIDELGGELLLIHCGGAELDYKYVEFFHNIGIEVLCGYGISECSPVIAANMFNKTKKKSVGKPLPKDILQLNIVNDEILVKGKTVSPGYYNDKENTDLYFTDGWFATGDLGYLDKEGYLYITGRKKNLIILSNGENVSPENIEQELLNSDYVEEVLVRAEKQPSGNYSIVADIFPGDAYLKGNSVEQKLIKEKLDELVKRYNQDKAIYKQIFKYYILSEALKKNALGKVIRK